MKITLAILFFPFAVFANLTNCFTAQLVKTGDPFSNIGGGVSPFQVDTFFDAHSQTEGTQYGWNPSADAYGNTNLWHVEAEHNSDPTPPNFAIAENVAGPDIHFSTSRQTPDGHIADGTGTHWIRDDMTSSAGWMRIAYGDFANSARVYSEFYFSPRGPFVNTSGSQANQDKFEFYTPYAVLQASLLNNSDTLRMAMHTDHGDAASNIPTVQSNSYYKGTIYQDFIFHIAFAEIFDTNGTFVSSSISYNVPGIDQIRWYRQMGYLAPFSAGALDSTAFAIKTTDVDTNRPPYVPQPPTNLSAEQTGDGEAVLGFDDHNFLLCSNRPSLSNASEGDLTGWIAPGTTVAIFEGLTPGSTYDVRDTAYFQGGVKSVTVLGPPITITNLPSVTFVSTFDDSVHRDATDGPLIGYKITVDASHDFVVTDLGSLAKGNSDWLLYTSITVEILDSSCGVVASAIVDASAGDWTYYFTSITPVTLTHGQSYQVVVDNNLGATANLRHLIHAPDADVPSDINGCNNSTLDTPDAGYVEPNFKGFQL